MKTKEELEDECLIGTRASSHEGFSLRRNYFLLGHRTGIEQLFEGAKERAHQYEDSDILYVLLDDLEFLLKELRHED